MKTKISKNLALLKINQSKPAPPRRIINLLMSAGIIFLGELATKNKQDIFKIRNVGPINFKEIEKFLKIHNCSLDMRVTYTVHKALKQARQNYFRPRN